ncbi:trypsin-like serine protease [Streptomyces lavendulocolor]|uniref:trypsin-like serine protease n=1 Tax=Streptomyces lavendulocolor TaxID=67316 RepID=UPI0031E1D53D
MASSMMPGKVHTASFKASAGTATTLTLDAAGPGGTICQGDAGGPVLNTNGELVALNSRSWQGGCLGTDPAETRTGAVAVRTDDLRDWILQTRALATGWKTETLVQAGDTLHQGIRLAGGDWTGFTDVQTKAGDIGGIRNAATAGINGDTHVLAISKDARLFHTVRKADGTWGTFGDVGAVAGRLSNLTQVSAVSIGNDLHVVAVADGRIFHTIRNTTGHWTNWGDVAAAVGSPTGPITSVSMAGAGNDAHIVIATDNGTRQYHAIRNGNGTWSPLGDLKDVLGVVTATSLSAAAVDGELQLAVTTADNKALHTVRRTDRTWAATTRLDLQGVPGTPDAIAITGTL